MGPSVRLLLFLPAVLFKSAASVSWAITFHQGCCGWKRSAPLVEFAVLFTASTPAASSSGLWVSVKGRYFFTVILEAFNWSAGFHDLLLFMLFLRRRVLCPSSSLTSGGCAVAPVRPGECALIIETGLCGQRWYKGSSFTIYPRQRSLLGQTHHLVSHLASFFWYPWCYSHRTVVNDLRLSITQSELPNETKISFSYGLLSP